MLLAILQGCNPTTNKVIPDETAKKIFTLTELEGIGRMIHFVDSIVSKKTGLTDINASYRACLDSVNADIKKGPITPLLNDSAKFDFLETINNDAFSTIWEEDILYIHSESRCRKFLRLSFHGKYTEYLQKTGETDELYAIIYEDFNKGRDFSPTMVVTFLKNHHELDFTLYRHRLWATIFLLRMPEPIKVP